MQPFLIALPALPPQTGRAPGVSCHLYPGWAMGCLLPATSKLHGALDMITASTTGLVTENAPATESILPRINAQPLHCLIPTATGPVGPLHGARFTLQPSAGARSFPHPLLLWSRTLHWQFGLNVHCLLTCPHPLCSLPPAMPCTGHTHLLWFLFFLSFTNFPCI